MKTKAKFAYQLKKGDILLDPDYEKFWFVVKSIRRNDGSHDMVMIKGKKITAEKSQLEEIYSYFGDEEKILDKTAYCIEQLQKEMGKGK